MTKNITIILKATAYIFLGAILTNCNSGQNELLNKAWKYSSYTDSLDLSKPPKPPDFIPSSIADQVRPIQKYALLMNCIKNAKNGKDTFIKFEEDFNSSEKEVAKFTIYEKEEEPILTGKIRIWNDLSKISVRYDQLGKFSLSEEFEIISLTKDELVLRFDDGGMLVTGVFIQSE